MRIGQAQGVDLGEARHPGREHQLLKLQQQLGGDLGVGGIQGVTDAEAEGVAGGRIAIRPAGPRPVQANAVDVEKLVGAGAAGVVAEHQPAVDVEVEAERSLQIGIHQGEGGLDRPGQIAADAAEQAYQIGAVEAEAPIQLRPFGEGELIYVESRIAARRGGLPHQQFDQAAGCELQLHLHEAVLGGWPAREAWFVFGQEPQV